MEEHTEIDEQRSHERKDLEASVAVRFEAQALTGAGENRSPAGIMLTTEDTIRVVIDIIGPNGPEALRGRLVRVQRMSESSLGLAIEFED